MNKQIDRDIKIVGNTVKNSNKTFTKEICVVKQYLDNIHFDKNLDIAELNLELLRTYVNTLIEKYNH